MTAQKTAKLYGAAQDQFREWCRYHKIMFPASHEQVAKYLKDCLREHGYSSVPIHLAALGHLYRDNGHALDTKAPAIRAVMTQVRQQ